ncbi:MAG TPA: winged helix-turn-helix domain-containing protein [Steroidobacteraceae bacterium]|nr:winged helix-turn-helix domain-containing protein [Steroidobacteraceae bacterium]
MDRLNLTAGTWSFGPFTLDVAERSLRSNEEPVELGPRAFDLLVTLISRAGRLISKNDLLDQVWAGRVVEENNLQVQMSALRKVLGPDAIETIPGRGYRFIMPVEQASQAARRVDEVPMAAKASPPQRPDLACVQQPLYGRALDLAAVVDEVREHNLVTLTGAGGIGKTRLAEVAASSLSAAFADGVVWVDLAPLASGAVVSSAVALAIGLEPAEGTDVTDAVVEALQRQSLLLVLDNAEHLIDTVGLLAERIVQKSPHVRQLVTSQAPLRIPGERVYQLDSLDIPDPTASLEKAVQFGAIALFAERARDLDRRFVLDAGNVAIVIEICRRLDGIPLALELAAARVRSLGLAAIAARIDQRFRLLVKAGCRGPSRQQTLHAAFDWSYELLGCDERKVFRRLGAFVGPFTLGAASLVVAEDSLDEWDVIDRLGILVDRSLVAVGGGDQPHYRLSETARAYALEQLKSAAEQDPISRASRLYEDGGDAAAARSGNQEAVVQYSAGLEIARLLSVSAERDARELAIYLKLGPAVQTTASPGSEQCEAIYNSAVELAGRVGTIRDRFLALWGYWHFLCMAGREREAVEHADSIVALASQSQDDGLVLEGCHASLTTQQLIGNPCSVVRHAERALELYDPVRHAGLRYVFGGHDPGICAASQASIALWLAGQPDRALSMAAHALRLAESAQHAYSEAVAYYYTAMTYWACGEEAEFVRVSHALADVSERYSMDILLTEGRLLRGRASYESCSTNTGIAEMRDALSRIEATGELSFLLFYSALLADALLATNELGEADSRLRRAFAATSGGQGFFLPEIHRLRGELYARRGNGAGAREELAYAMQLAREQGSVSLALRAAVSIVEQMIVSKETEPARKLIVAALEQIEGGSLTRDVRRAVMILESLR